MKRKKHGREEVIRKLREAEVMEGQGQTLAQVDYRTPAAFASVCRAAPPLGLAALALAPSPHGTREGLVESVPLI